MLTIRLSRIGKKNKPMYRLVISEKARDPYGRALEILGSYNPYSKDLQVKADRIKHWLSVGAQMSSSVNNLLISKGVVSGEKAKSHKLNTKKQLKKKESISVEAKTDKPEDKPVETSKEEPKETSAPAESVSEKPEEKPAETSPSAETPAPAETDKTENKPVEEKKESGEDSKPVSAEASASAEATADKTENKEENTAKEEVES